MKIAFWAFEEIVFEKPINLFEFWIKQGKSVNKS